MLAEAANISAAIPGCKYDIPEQDVFKKRSESIQFDKVKTGRLDPIKRLEQTDFYETNVAIKATQRLEPSNSFSKSPKASFAAQAAKKNKVPGAGAYKISDKAYRMLSPSPMARKR